MHFLPGDLKVISKSPATELTRDGASRTQSKVFFMKVHEFLEAAIFQIFLGDCF